MRGVAPDGSVIVVGRIYEDGRASTPPEMQWLSSILEIIRVPGVATSGRAPTVGQGQSPNSVQSELTVDCTDLRRFDQARVRDCHRMQRSLEVFEPERQETV